jgi:hypothetical protein
MNSDKPLHEDPHAHSSTRDRPADTIPLLDEAFNPTYSRVDEPRRAPVVEAATDHLVPENNSPYNEEGAMELSVNLGYASDSAEETDDLADMEEIQTLPLAEMVMDESASKLTVSALEDEQKRQIATLEAIVFEGDDPTAPAPRYTPEHEPAAELSPQEPAPPTATDGRLHCTGA